MNLEQALIVLSQATDPRGLPVILHSGDLTVSSLRKSTINFGESMFGKNVVYFDARGTHPEICEAVAWENLSKLANAVAAALREKHL